MNIEEYTNNKFPWLRELKPVATKIVETLIRKEEGYGGSWQKRGGQGAFMMLARKWDRIENVCRENEYDIFKVIKNNSIDTVDDIDDLIGYLLLVRAKVQQESKKDITEKSYETVRAQKILDVTADSKEQDHPFGFNAELDIPPDLPAFNAKHKPLKG